MKNDGIIKFSDFCKSVDYSKELKLGIIGGTFNPVHWGHIQCAQIAADKLGLNHVLLMPANIPNFKQDQEIADAKDRLAMCQLAVEQTGDSRLHVCDYEVFSQGISYTSETLKHVHNHLKKYTNAFEIFFISGSDILTDIKKWHNYKQIFDFGNVVAVSRKGQKISPDIIDNIANEFNGKVIFIKADAIKASSQLVRMLACEYLVKFDDKILQELYKLCPSKVVDYFVANKLY